MRRNRILVGTFLLSGLLGADAHVAAAGSGEIVPNPGAGAAPYVLNLSVYFEYDEPDPEAWLPVFNAASALLYNATEEQVQFGAVALTAPCPGAKEGADIVIAAGTDGAQADPLGLGISGRHVYLTQSHRSAAGAALGQYGLVQALGKYVFGLEPEHDGLITRLPFPDGISSIIPVSPIPAEPFFCAAPTGGIACIMDGGSVLNPNNLRTEFCTPSAGAWATRHFPGYSQETTRVKRRDMAVYVRNAQQVMHGQSAWETIVDVANERYRIPLTMPFTEPVNTIAGYAALLAFEPEAPCPTAQASVDLVIITDVSITYGDDIVKMKELGETMLLTLSTTLADIRFGLASFSDFPFPNYGGENDAAYIFNQALTYDQETVLAAIDALSTLNGFDEPEGQLEALYQVATGVGRDLNADGDYNDPGEIAPRDMGFEPDREHIVVLSTDAAFHDSDTEPAYPGAGFTETVAALQAAGIRVIGLYSSPQAEAALIPIANATGGTTRSLESDSGNILEAILSGLSEIIAAQTVMQSTAGDAVVAGFTPVPFFVDTLTDRIRVEATWGNSSVDLDIRIQRPDGSLVNPGDPGVTFLDSGQASEFYEIVGAPSGLWDIGVVGVTIPTGVPEPYTLEMTDQTGEVQATVRVDNPAPRSPDPTRIEVILIADGPPVTAGSITGIVTRPDDATPRPTEVPIALFDDGSPYHGDTVRGDGIYSTYFAEYTAPGTYFGQLQLINSDGVTTPPDEEGIPFAAAPTPPFVREREFQFMLTGVPPDPDTPPASVILSRPRVWPRRRWIGRSVIDEVVANVRLRASEREAVFLDQVAFSASGTLDDTTISQVKLYIDGDHDGDIDRVGPFAAPVATGGYDADNGQVVFTNVMLIEAARFADLLLAYDIDVDAVERGARRRRGGRRLTFRALTSSQHLQLTGATTGQPVALGGRARLKGPKFTIRQR